MKKSRASQRKRSQASAKKGGIIAALRRSPLVDTELDLLPRREDEREAHRRLQLRIKS